MDWYSMTNTRIERIVGERIKKLRLEYNITQQDLAKKTGLSRVSISKIERGMGVNLSSLLEIMRGLRVLENIEHLIPEPEISPIEIIRLKNKTKKKRASTKK